MRGSVVGTRARLNAAPIPPRRRRILRSPPATRLNGWGATVSWSPRIIRPIRRCCGSSSKRWATRSIRRRRPDGPGQMEAGGYDLLLADLQSAGHGWSGADALHPCRRTGTRRPSADHCHHRQLATGDAGRCRRPGWTMSCPNRSNWMTCVIGSTAGCLATPMSDASRRRRPGVGGAILDMAYIARTLGDISLPQMRDLVDLFHRNRAHRTVRLPQLCAGTSTPGPGVRCTSSNPRRAWWARSISPPWPSVWRRRRQPAGWTRCNRCSPNLKMPSAMWNWPHSDWSRHLVTPTEPVTTGVSRNPAAAGAGGGR